MIDVIKDYFFLSLINDCAILYVMSKILNKKVNFKLFSTYLILILFSILVSLNYYYVNEYLRITVVTLLLCIFNKLMFGFEINKTVISTILEQFIFMISDFVFAIFLVYILKFNSNGVVDTYFGTLLANVFVSVLVILIISIPVVKRICFRIIDITIKITSQKIIIFSLLAIVSINILMMFIYFKTNIIYLVLINFVMILIYSFILFRTLNEKNRNIIVEAENDALMTSLGDYENMLDYQRVANHENKNQLLVIKSMIDKGEKNISDYINTIIKDKKEDDEILLTKAKTIPTGGMQGLIYQKMLLMKEKHIPFELDVSKSVKKYDFESMSVDKNYKLCKILGVFLDNAIEESIKLDEKLIEISLYIDLEGLCIEVANYYGHDFDVDNLNSMGYTTKGEGHGYGLSLVRDIVEHDSSFKNNSEISGKKFKQILNIKI